MSSSRFFLSKEDLLSPTLELPSISKLASIFRTRKFILELLPYKEGEPRLFKAICNSYSYSTKVKQPINTSNLNTHYRLKHYTLNTSSTNIIDKDSTIEDSSTIESSSINTLNSYFKSPSLKKRPSFVFFSKEEYKNYLLSFIINNNLPFSIVDSPSFNNLIKYLKDNIPSISRATIRRELDTFYNVEVNKLKVLLSKNSSRFSITIDEWRSSNNIDFLAITLHFIDNNFILKSYLIGFKDLSNYESYTSTILYPILNTILKEYNIQKTLISITRDNASAINRTIELLKDKYNTKYNYNIIDIKCTAHILNLVSNSFLDYTFFTINNTKRFNNSITNLVEDNTTIDFSTRKALPSLIRSFINKFKYNHFLKSNFKKVVKNSKLNTTNIGPEILIKDNSTRWLSTYNMLERVLYFRDEITIILNKANNLSNSKKKELSLDFFNLKEEEQDYIIKIVDILEYFKKPTIKLQGSTSNTYTIVYISQLYNKLKSIEDIIDDSFLK